MIQYFALGLINHAYFMIKDYFAVQNILYKYFVQIAQIVFMHKIT